MGCGPERSLRQGSRIRTPVPRRHHHRSPAIRQDHPLQDAVPGTAVRVAFDSGVVIDEIQRVPELLSYIQLYADERRQPGFFILTGSWNLLLLESVSQSLAGRTALVTLLPFTLREAYQDRVPPPLEEVLYTGFYPRIFDQGLNPSEASSFYVSTYVERDLRQLINVRDLSQFETFLKLCAGRTVALDPGDQLHHQAAPAVLPQPWQTPGQGAQAVLPGHWAGRLPALDHRPAPPGKPPSEGFPVRVAGGLGAAQAPPQPG